MEAPVVQPALDLKTSSTRLEMDRTKDCGSFNLGSNPGRGVFKDQNKI